MDERIKSAFEKAMERAGQMQEVPAEELVRAENMPKGSMMAARFLREKDYDLAAALAGENPAIRPYLLEGARETFLLNINLPPDEEAISANRRAMSGLATIGKNQGALAEALGELEYLFDYYGKVMDSTYQRLRNSFGQRVERAQKKVESRLAPGMVIDVEKQPAFLEEWSRVRSQLGNQFEDKLSEVKQRIREID